MSRGEMMVRWSSDSAEKYRAAMSCHVLSPLFTLFYSYHVTLTSPHARPTRLLQELPALQLDHICVPTTRNGVTRCQMLHQPQQKEPRTLSCECGLL